MAENVGNTQWRAHYVTEWPKSPRTEWRGWGTAGATAAEPIAIVGMSCRFAPDLDSPERFWEFLARGANTVSEMPAKRWDPYADSSPEATGILRGTTRKGSFLDDIEGFDAEFFQITPREAEFLDPQQRVMLELAWEALGDAGVAPSDLGGTDVGVFMSANSNDYGRRLLEDLPRTGAWAVNGTTYYGIANRISYFLDLRGPSVAVDTACAGSLTAIHVACQSLLAGESPVAIVGGVNIMSSPALVVALDAAQATSPDGRSKAFDAAADGYGRGEGAGVVVLKRLSDAVRDGDPVRAVIRGTGVFQDGRSDGMMAPSGVAQEHMLRQVYERAGIDPRTVDYVEAHGTGTPRGDREEATAIARVFGPGRDSRTPLLLGSVKPNIGHVEAASGIAGVIKVVLALESSQIPVSLHHQVNPSLNLADSNLRLVGEPTPWPAADRLRRAGVSSYGVGGTIAHLVLEEAPRELAAQAADADPDEATRDLPRVFPLSAGSEAGVRALAGRTAEWLRANPEAPLHGLAHTLTRRRSHLGARMAAVASGPAELADLLTAVGDGDRAPAAVLGQLASGRNPGAVWVFSGHGAQWSGMGQELLRQDPVFAAVIDDLEQVYQAELGWTPRELIEAGGPWTVTTVQAITFAMQVALAEVWRAHGARPAAVIGHSVGEIAASVVAGSLERKDAARFACRRAAALDLVAGRGGMALVGLSLAEAETLLSGRQDVVAAISASPRSTVVSGDRAAVEELVTRLPADGIEARPVRTDVAFHSPHVDAVLPTVAAAAAALSACEPEIPLYSSALADPRAGDLREGAYWETNLRAPVRFAQAVQAALDDGFRLFLEVSSHPVVAHSVTETVEAAGIDDAVVATSLRREQPELATLLTGLGQLYCAGMDVDWPHDGPLVAAPVVAWQHRPYWIFPEQSAGSGGRGHDPDSHTLLGGHSTVAAAPVQHVWQTHLDLSNRPYAQSHKVVGVETVPASVVLNSFIAAAATGDDRPGLKDIVFRTPLAATPPRVVQVVMEQNQVRLASRLRREDADAAPGHDDEWLTHTTATVDRNPVVGSRPMEDLDTVRSRCPESWTWQRVDSIFRNMGVDGYTFPWVVEELHRGDREQVTVVTVDHTPKLHPSSWTAVIDAALTVSGVLVLAEDSRILRTSSNLESIAFRGAPPPRIVVHTTLSSTQPDTVDLLVADEHGNVVAEASGLRYIQVQDPTGSNLGPRDLVHELSWTPLTLPETPTGPGVEVVYLLGDPAVTTSLQQPFASRGVTCVRLGCAADLRAAVTDRPGVLLVAPPRQAAGETPEDAAERSAFLLIDAAQQVSALGDARSGTTLPVKLWCVSQGVRTPVRESALGQAPLWGVSRIIGGERSDFWGGVIDLADEVTDGDDGVDAWTAALVLDLLTGVAGDEDVISVDHSGASAARLTQVERQATSTPVDCRPDGTYLVTGGLGALGLEVARFLVDRGARRLVLAGRRGLPARSRWAQVEDPALRSQIDAVLALETLGATVKVLAIDVSDEEAMTAALDPSALGMPPVTGIVHAAGVVSDALVDKTGRDGLRTTLRPKARGAMVLHRLFPPGTVDFFMLFSSCGQLARLTGQASYAAANSFLDGLAALRHASGHTDTVSLAWAQWRGKGMGETTASTTILEAEARGMGGISTAEAFRCWAFVDRFPLPYAAILRVLPERSLPIFSALDSVAEIEAGASAGAVNWSAVPVDELGDRVLAEVHEQVAEELNLSTADTPPDRPLVELGVDSVLTVALRVRLHRRFGIDLPPTILWSSPTIRAVALFLVGALTEGRSDTPSDGTASAEEVEKVGAVA